MQCIISDDSHRELTWHHTVENGNSTYHYRDKIAKHDAEPPRMHIEKKDRHNGTTLKYEKNINPLVHLQK